MGLIKCEECSKEISSEAEACPYCGYKKKKAGCLAAIGYGIIAVIVISLIGQCSLNSKNDNAEKSTKADQEYLAKLTPEQREKELKTRSDLKEMEEKRVAKEKREESNRSFMAYQSFKAVRSSLNDPDSLIIESITSNEKGTVICIDYRAKNAYGGYIKSYVTYMNGKPSTSAESWNANCRKEMYDYSYVKEMKL